ncbi:MAG: ABC transporter ATP-binding protein [Lentisphaeria bacterium]|jgi:putative ABC transport system ATP-binding protein
MSEPLSASPAAATPAAAAAAPLFRACGLRKEFTLGKRHVIEVLKGVDLEIRAGEWVALVGPSGCGKSTLLLLLGALDNPSAGEIWCRGRAYHQLSSAAKTRLRRREIGFVFQNFHLFPELTAVENVVLPALQWGEDRGGAERRARELLERFGLGHRLEHRPQELSGGEQQRVALARALINDPAILLADEPTGNLDVAAAAGIVELLAQLHREAGKTVVMVTHDPELAAKADRILRLADGRAA